MLRIQPCTPPQCLFGMSQEVPPKIRSHNQCPESTFNPNWGRCGVTGPGWTSWPAGKSPAPVATLTARCQEAQLSPGISSKAAVYRLGPNSCPRAACRPGLLPSFLQDAPDPLAIQEVTKPACRPSPHSALTRCCRKRDLLIITPLK